MQKRDEQLLVAIMNNQLDMRTAQQDHWYRIPVSSQRKWLANRWPPRWIAFYQTKLFNSERYSVRYYAPVLSIRERSGHQLLPERGFGTEKGQKRYFQLMLGPLQELPQPIFSRRLRRITFIPTTYSKFLEAEEINDLYDDSPLENRLWAALKRARIEAERQFHVTAGDENYFLDFAIRCAAGNIDVETDGDLYHVTSEASAADNFRNNALTKYGWRILRYTTAQVQEKLESYCIPNIAGAIDNLGGLDREGELPRIINLPEAGKPHQPTLFD